MFCESPLPHRTSHRNCSKTEVFLSGVQLGRERDGAPFTESTCAIRIQPEVEPASVEEFVWKVKEDFVSHSW